MSVIRFRSHRALRLSRWLTALAAISAGATISPGWSAGSLAAQAGAQGFCASEVSDTVVYFTAIFDTKLNPKVPIETGSISREFHEYLKGRYRFTNRNPYASMCGVAPNAGASESGRGSMLARAPETSKKVEVEWIYQPDTAWVTASLAFVRDQGGYGSAPPKQGPDHGYCFSQPTDGSLFVSAVFEVSPPPANLALWQIAYSKYLGPKNGFIGTVSCSNGSLNEGQRMVKARSDGVRAAGRKVVETGWKYDPAATTVAAAKPDPDPEPAAAPPPPAPPPASARDFATKEMPEVMALCNNDRLMSGAFDCNLVARVVYNYRLAHWGAGAEPEPLATLVAGEKLDCSTCVKQFADMWAASRAQSNGYQLAPAQCVGKRFAEGIRAKPQLTRVKDLFDVAMKACPK